MKKYVAELNYDVEILESEKEALNLAEYHWNHKTEAEREDIEYFKVYEIEAENNEQIEETSDLTELMTRLIKNYKEN